MKKTNKLSQEQIKKKLLDAEYNTLLKCKIPEPTIIYSVGQKVTFGSIKESIIIEMSEDKKLLLLDQLVVENNYGRPFEYRKNMWVSWVDVVPYKSDEENNKIPSLIENKEIRQTISFQQRSVASILINQYKEFGGIDLNPDYQRGHVWEQKHKQALIKSIFENIDIGKFVFIYRTFEHGDSSGNFYEVLDGKQRVTAILEFYENRFQYEGFYFKDLCVQDRHHFENYMISYCQVNEKGFTDEMKYKYFLMLNVSGVPQDEEHIQYVRSLYENCKK
ncbi:MAG: DUF262 domain-containing protein [Bacteroidales bacterium]|jgi:hypothetical protein|nr:DUF262 domain-containing protein [Bacteroidales bacterium]